MAESDLTGRINREFVFFNGKRIARVEYTYNEQGEIASATPHYYFSDHLGSASIVTSATGAIEEDAVYYPFGGEPTDTSAAANRYRFTGKERDAETGLDYFIARHYMSTKGRFIQPDEFTGGPVDAFGGDPAPPGPLPYADIRNPQSLNKYAYTTNNPVRFTDPDGHCGTLCFGIIGAAAGAVIYGGVDAYFQYKDKGQVDWKQTGKQAVKGAAIGYVVGSAGGEIASALEGDKAKDDEKPTEPYDREKHYGKTPTDADRKAVGGESTDHDPPLVKRYYEGDSNKGEKPGFKQTAEERKASAADRDRMRQSTKAEQNSQGGEMSHYSKGKKKELGLEKKKDD